MTKSQPRPLGTYFCRFAGTAEGLKIRAWSRITARRLFAEHHGLDPKNPYIIVSDTRAKDVVFTDLPAKD